MQWDETENGGSNIHNMDLVHHSGCMCFMCLWSPITCFYKKKTHPKGRVFTIKHHVLGYFQEKHVKQLDFSEYYVSATLIQGHSCHSSGVNRVNLTQDICFIATQQSWEIFSQYLF